MESVMGMHYRVAYRCYIGPTGTYMNKFISSDGVQWRCGPVAYVVSLELHIANAILRTTIGYCGRVVY